MVLEEGRLRAPAPVHIEHLQAFLRRVDSGRTETGSSWDLDRADLRECLVDLLADRSPWRRRLGHAEWAREVDSLAETLASLPDDQVWHRTQTFARRVLESAFVPSGDSVERLEARRVLDLCRERGVQTLSYAQENLLIQRGATALTALGRPLLNLPPLDAIRWVLTIETELANGLHGSVWRVAPQEFEQLEDAAVSYQEHLDDVDFALSVSDAALARLLAWGVIEASWNDGAHFPSGLRVAPAYRSMVRSLTEANPWRAAVRAALEDLRASSVPSVLFDAKLATRDYVKLVTHEVRNALGPVRFNLSQLIKQRPADGLDRLEAAHEGVLRTLHFVDELVHTAELTAERRMRISVAALLQRALRAFPDTVEVEVDEGEVTLAVAPELMTRALVNVLRNAFQAKAQHVRVKARRTPDATALEIDDDGPGVPVPLRAAIFEEGFTTTPGGTGFGLAFVRRVLAEHHGTVRCEASDLGGARFVLTLPAEAP